MYNYFILQKEIPPLFERHTGTSSENENGVKFCSISEPVKMIADAERLKFKEITSQGRFYDLIVQ